MDDRKIRQLAKIMTTSRDLHNVLNVIKKDMAEELGVEFYPILWDNYCFFSSPIRSARNYISFEIPKKSGGYRHISAPVRGLKEIQKCLNLLLELIYYPQNNVTGFVRGKSIVDNAMAHIGKNYIFNVDLQDFFLSIDQARVWKKLQLRPLCLKKDVASAIAGLCSMAVEDEQGNMRYVLPQGAPTSPMLSNIICERLDWKLSGVARRFGLTYTRYADDITFSSMHNVYQPDGDFQKELHRIIEDEHFKVNAAKVKLQKRGGHQEVTGLVISDKVNVSKKYVREIRSLLFMWECYGYAVACQKYTVHHGAYATHGKPEKFASLENILDGKIEYLKMVKGGKNPLYLTLRLRLDKLLGKETKKYKAQQVENRIAGEKNHDIEATYEFLHLFEKPEGLKYLTHDFPDANWTISKLMQQCKTVFNEEARKRPFIPQSLYSLVHKFIFGIEKDAKSWLGNDGKSYIDTWADWEQLDTHPIKQKQYGEVIDVFRNTIRIRSPKFLDLIQSFESQNIKLRFEYNSLELAKVDFYTNVYILRWCLARIFSMFNQYQEHEEIKISCIKKTKDEWLVYAIRLTQMNSFPSIDISDAVKRVNNKAGDLSDIKNRMRGYCDWSVITRWNSGNMRWNILKSKETEELEELSEAAEGFTHEFVFYKSKSNE